MVIHQKINDPSLAQRRALTPLIPQGLCDHLSDFKHWARDRLKGFAVNQADIGNFEHGSNPLGENCPVGWCFLRLKALF
jgi:hypothetical protein